MTPKMVVPPGFRGYTELVESVNDYFFYHSPVAE